MCEAGEKKNCEHPVKGEPEEKPEQVGEPHGDVQEHSRTGKEVANWVHSENRPFSYRQKGKPMSGRSLEVTRVYLQRGQAAYRSVWIKVTPRHPLLKAAVALPLAALVLLMLVFILIALGLTLLAIALIAAISRGKEKGTNRKG